MYFTAFLPFFLLIFLYAMRRPSNWAIATGIMAFFQSASPILLVGGGRISGMAPAYCLIPIGGYHLIRLWVDNRNKGLPEEKIPTPIWLIGYFTFISIGGALLLPRLFAKSVRVLASGYGLDSGFTIPLEPSGANYIQSFYLAMNFALIIIPASLARSNLLSRSDIIKGVIIGAVISAGFGYYQLLAFSFNLPWPSSILNSNLGVNQLSTQTALGFQRMSATFLEPSFLSQHFLAAVGIILLGLNKKLLGTFILIALLISTSSSAYFGLLILIISWSLFDIKSRMPQTMRLLMLFSIVVGGAYALDLYTTNGMYTKLLIFGKFQTQSGESRLYADSLALSTLAQTYGLGAGIGSLRSSSFLVGLAATAGIHGILLFLAFLGALFIHLKRDDSSEARAILFGLLGCTIGWALSVPDSAIPLFWILAGAGLIGYKPVFGKSTPLPEGGT